MVFLTTEFVIRSYKVGVINFMKIHSIFLYLCLSLATASPTLSHAQVSLPVWLQPTWMKTKSTDFPVKNSDRYDVTPVTVVTNNGILNPKLTPQMNTQSSLSDNSQMLPPPFKQTVNLAPVETAVPKLNEKHLTTEELKELRKQLRQQR